MHLSLTENFQIRIHHYLSTAGSGDVIKSIFYRPSQDGIMELNITMLSGKQLTWASHNTFRNNFDEVVPMKATTGCPTEIGDCGGLVSK